MCRMHGTGSRVGDYSKGNVIASSVQVIHERWHVRFSVSVESAGVGKGDVSQHGDTLSCVLILNHVHETDGIVILL